jgi:hypothetical protein
VTLAAGQVPRQDDGMAALDTPRDEDRDDEGPEQAAPRDERQRLEPGVVGEPGHRAEQPESGGRSYDSGRSEEERSIPHPGMVRASLGVRPSRRRHLFDRL